ncbi:hypothetical protein MKZ17_10225 [Solibacillus sp. FSL R7-0682]|uniref:hypothetical protein n=1 Tax=Solibacillus sp. FSL R7-0682 TaxID=2921690 RepID=UPI0030FBA4A8
MKKQYFFSLLFVSFVLASCGKDTTIQDAGESKMNENSKSTATMATTSNSTLHSYDNEHGAFEVFYTKDNLGLVETNEDYGLEVSSIEYGEFSVADTFDYYPDLENDDGKIGYVKVKIEMNLPENIDPSQFFYPDQTTLTITEEFQPASSDNNFADPVSIELGEITGNEGYLFYLLSPAETKALKEAKSVTLTTMAPFTSKNMDIKEGYHFKVTLD